MTVLDDTRVSLVRTVTAADVVTSARVDDALADFLDDAIALVAAASGSAERVVRDWMEHELLTEQGFRRQVLRGPTRGGGALDGAAGGVGDGPGDGAGDGAVDVLEAAEDAYVVRSDVRSGVRWFELGHDRLVQPLLASNRRWRSSHLAPWQQSAHAWSRRGRPPELLATGDDLRDGLAAVAAEPEIASDADRDYLTESARAAAMEARRLARRRRTRLLRGAMAAAVVAFVLVVAVAFSASRERDRLTADLPRVEAERAGVLAELDRARAEADTAERLLQTARADQADAEALLATAERDAAAARAAADEARAAVAATLDEAEQALAAAAEAQLATLEAEDASSAVVTARVETEALVGSIRSERLAIEAELQSVKDRIMRIEEDCVAEYREAIRIINVGAMERDRRLAGFIALASFDETTSAIRSFLATPPLPQTC